MPGKSSHYCILLVYLSLLLSNVTAQERKLKFEYLTPNDGLSQASVSRILQDKVGFMWFGTRNGLNRYDGYTFTKYYHDAADSTSISGDLIEALYEDHDQNIWIGTNDGFSLYDREHDAFINFKNHPNFPKEFLGLSIDCIFQDSQGIYWIGSYGAGLVRFDRKENEFTLFSHNDNNTKSISSNQIHAIIEDAYKNIWIATEIHGLNLFNPIDNSFTCFLHNDKDSLSISSNIIWALARDSKGTIWIGTLGEGLCKLQKTDKGSYIFKSFKPKTEDIRRLKILSIYIDKDDGIWLGTENGGLDYYNQKSGLFINYCFDEKRLNTLNSNSIQSIYEDKTGNLWIGTYTGGVNVDKRFKKKIDSYRKIAGNENSLSFNAVTCFYIDKQNYTWVGTDGGGLNVIDIKNEKYTHYKKENSELLSDAVLVVNEDAYQNIWIGGWECGLNLFDRNTHKIKNLSIAKFGLPNNNIFDIVFDKKRQLWISFGGDGFGMFNYQKNILKNYSTKNSKLPIDWVFDIDIDKAGNILLGHSKGFSIFDPVKETFQNFVHNEFDSNSISHNQINCILVAGDSTIWIGTPSGLNHYNEKTGVFKRFSTFNGLPNNSIVGLVEDNSRNIWISTNDGISKYSISDKSFKNYNLADGLQGKDFIRASCVRTPNGDILFGGTNGFNIFNPDSLLDNLFQPEIVITDFLIFNKSVRPNEKNSPLQKSILVSDSIFLTYKHSVISFEFAALDYTAPQQNHYLYKLEGFDKDWNDASSSRTATYTNLDPGEYILRIKATNNDGKWSEHERNLYIHIEPPFWKTLLFKCLVFLIIISLVYLFYKNRVNQLTLINEKLEEKVEKRTHELHNRTTQLEEVATLLEEKQEEINSQNEEIRAQRDSVEETNRVLLEQQSQILHQNKELAGHRTELESKVVMRTQELEAALNKAEESDRLKSSFLANMSHEIRTPMNAILGFSSILDDEDITPKIRNEYIEIINRNGESLLVLINDIIDFSTIQANQMKMTPRSFQLHTLLNQVCDTFKIEKQNKGIDLQLKTSALQVNFILFADEIRLKQVFNNLIVNAFKFTHQGYIEFGVFAIDDDITFYVKDSGIGIPEKVGDSIFEHFMKIEENKSILYRGTGLGLAICKNLVELWGGKIWYESKENLGTIFYFSHPLIANHSIPNNSKPHISEKEILSMAQITILIAENEDDNYLLLSKYLAPYNFKLLWAKDGKEAIDMASANVVDIILMDIKMPGINGIEASREIKKHQPQLPIIAQTAYTYENEIQEMMKAGMDDYLSKPIISDKLLAILRKYLKNF